MRTLDEVPFQELKIGQVVYSKHTQKVGFICGTSAPPLCREEIVEIYWSGENVKCSALFHMHGQGIEVLEDAVLTSTQYHAQRDIDEVLEKFEPLFGGDVYNERQRECASKLHALLCSSNHTDGCSWFYDSFDKPGGIRQEFLERAARLLFAAANIGVSGEQVVSLLDVVDSL